MTHPAEAITVDAHAHVFTKDMPLIGRPRHHIDYDFTAEDFLATLDAHGIGYGVIAAASPYGDYNDYTIASTRRSARLRGTAILEPTVDRYTLERMRDDGIVGVRFPYLGWPTPPDLTTFEWRRTLKRIADLDWHVHVHIEGEALPPVLATLAQFEIKTVVDHFGRPDPRLGVRAPGFRALIDAIERGRTWVKVSAGYRIGPTLAQACGRELLRTVGPDRLLWASDCPFVGHEREVTYQQTIDAVCEWVTNAEDRRRIFGANAWSFYFSGA